MEICSQFETWTSGVLHHGSIYVYSVFLFSFLSPDLVVDLGDGSFSTATLHQLVDGALAVTLEFVQVLVENLTGSQRRDQVVEFPPDLL